VQQAKKLSPDGPQPLVGVTSLKFVNDERYRGPMLQVLAWTFIYAGLVVLLTFFLGFLLAFSA